MHEVPFLRTSLSSSQLFSMAVSEVRFTRDESKIFDGISCTVKKELARMSLASQQVSMVNYDAFPSGENGLDCYIRSHWKLKGHWMENLKRIFGEPLINAVSPSCYMKKPWPEILAAGGLTRKTTTTQLIILKSFIKCSGLY
jgi:hypothetical protein